MSEWVYLSFSGPEGWLGAAIVEAPDVVVGAARAHALGCNPGGEVMGLPVPPEQVEAMKGYCDRLLTLEEVAELGGGAPIRLRSDGTEIT